MKKTKDLAKEYKEVLLDLHLVNKVVPPVMAAVLKRDGLLDKKGNITHEGVKVVHAYAEDKNRRLWLDK